MARKLGGFLIAPFPAALFQAIIVKLWPKPGQGVFEHPSAMFVVICLFYYLVGLLFGLPLMIIARRKGWRGAGAHGAIGLIATTLPIVVGLAAMRSPASAYVVAYNLLFFSIGGFVAGLVLWRVGQSPAVRARSEPHRPA
jgi:hypothetical protein